MYICVSDCFYLHYVWVNIVGRVRSTLEVATETEHQSTVLSLSVLQPHYQHLPGDQRYVSGGREMCEGGRCCVLGD